MIVCQQLLYPKPHHLFHFPVTQFLPENPQLSKPGPNLVKYSRHNKLGTLTLPGAAPLYSWQIFAVLACLGALVPRSHLMGSGMGVCMYQGMYMMLVAAADEKSNGDCDDRHEIATDGILMHQALSSDVLQRCYHWVQL